VYDSQAKDRADVYTVRMARGQGTHFRKFGKECMVIDQTN